jgi:hypothetical protein
MLSTGNTKLGKMHNWSIPAIHTCPGRSALCEALCYAAQGFYKMNNVIDALQSNLELCRQPGWADSMIKEIQKKKCTVVRIHVAGDFFNTGYLSDWIKICEACPNTTFYAYSRSWRVEALRPLLVKLGELSNVQLWWSVDKETGQAPKHSKIKQAYLSTDDDDKPTFDVDLIFREKQETVLRKVNDVQVCPYEIGVATKVTCQSCKICYREALIKIGA